MKKLPHFVCAEVESNEFHWSEHILLYRYLWYKRFFFCKFFQFSNSHLVYNCQYMYMCLWYIYKHNISQLHELIQKMNAYIHKSKVKYLNKPRWQVVITVNLPESLMNVWALEKNMLVNVNLFKWFISP